jgi:transposase InsO family protein
MMLRRPLEITQYLSIRYSERLVEVGIEASVGSVGDSYDNAMAETIIGLFKTEVIYARVAPAGTEEALGNRGASRYEPAALAVRSDVSTKQPQKRAQRR